VRERQEGFFRRTESEFLERSQTHNKYSLNCSENLSWRMITDA